MWRKYKGVRVFSLGRPGRASLMPFKSLGEKKQQVTGMSCVPQAVPVSASCPSVTATGAPSWSPGRQTRVTVRAGQSAKALRRERKPEGQREGESGAEGGSRRVPERAAPARLSLEGGGSRGGVCAAAPSVGQVSSAAVPTADCRGRGGRRRVARRRCRSPRVGGRTRWEVV